jgi:uncharacterized RDD family membrane protein YckC
VLRQRAAGAGAGSGAAPAAEPLDLPLFATPGAEDLPVVTPPPVARPPLAVRRPAGDTPRPRPAARPVEDNRLELDLNLPPAPEPEVPPTPRIVAESEPELAIVPDTPVTADAGNAAPLSARLFAGLVDVVLLAALAGAIVLTTLRVAGLPIEQAWRLPVAPLAAFVALLIVGYLTMCTVLAGQTAGKALVGLQVVEVGGRAVRFGPAVVRAVLQMVTVPLLGLGFLPAALAPDRRTLYDRLTNTEVIRTRK